VPSYVGAPLTCADPSGLAPGDKIFYDREGVLICADREHADVSMLVFHLLQSSLV
jgi:hypothetical protein